MQRMSGIIVGFSGTHARVCAWHPRAAGRHYIALGAPAHPANDHATPHAQDDADQLLLAITALERMVDHAGKDTEFQL